MTAQQFNEKYKDYIESGFEDQGLEFNYPEVTKYLDQVFQSLIQIPGFKYSQIKLKFGMCRFYVNGLNHELQFTIENKIDSIIIKYYA